MHYMYLLSKHFELSPSHYLNEYTSKAYLFIRQQTYDVFFLPRVRRYYDIIRLDTYYNIVVHWYVLKHWIQFYVNTLFVL